MKPTDHLEETIKKDLTFAAGPELHDRMLDGVLNAQSKRTKSVAIRPNRGRQIMKSPVAKLAAAGIMAMACLTGMLLWRGTQSGIALADVLARVEQVKAFSLKWSMKITIEDPNDPYHYEGRGTELISQEYGSKNTETGEESDPNGSLNTFQKIYFLPRKNVRIHIRPNQKEYLRVELNDMYVKQEQERGGLLLQNDPLYSLKNMLKHNYESLGRSTVDGIEVTGFQSKDPSFPPGIKKTLWVDLKTLLPVRYEYEHVKQTADNTKDYMHIVFSDFQWNLSVDAAEFEAPSIPDGYAIEDMFPELANEENAIGGFKQCVELLGNYPVRIALTYLWAESEKSETIAALQLKDELKGLTGLARDNKKMNALKPIRFLNKFYIGLAQKDSAYHGKTVTPKDADKVLLRWKLSDSEYRVIYGDLHLETVSPEKLAELEAALPK